MQVVGICHVPEGLFILVKGQLTMQSCDLENLELMDCSCGFFDVMSGLRGVSATIKIKFKGATLVLFSVCSADPTDP